MSSKRIILCLIVLFAVKTCALNVKTADSNDTDLYPAASLRFLHDGNRNEKRLSPYDFLIKKYSAAIGIDWRLLAAVIWHESKFDAGAQSEMSAKGLMQLRDVTALHFGQPDADLFDAETNISLGSKLIAERLEQFRKEGMEESDALRFALASYNSGGGALASRRDEALERGLDPSKWEDVAKVYADYSTVTPAYIQAVEETYERYCRLYRAASAN